MNIYKTFDNSGKNELVISNSEKLDAVNFIEQYILNFIKRMYGSVCAEKLLESNKMNEDDWFYRKDSLPLGHYFVARADSSGYTIYAIYETSEENNNYLRLYDAYQQKHINQVFSIFALNMESTDLTQSILHIKAKIEEDAKYSHHKDAWTRMAAQAADVANARTDHFHSV